MRPTAYTRQAVPVSCACIGANNSDWSNVHESMVLITAVVHKPSSAFLSQG
jgi:hypothetical protein